MEPKNAEIKEVVEDYMYVMSQINNSDVALDLLTITYGVYGFDATLCGCDEEDSHDGEPADEFKIPKKS